jgi:hypothetical protein
MTPEGGKQKLRAQFEVEGPSAMRHKVNSGFYWRDRHRAAAVEWLREKEEAEHASRAWGSRETWYANLIMILLSIIAILVTIIFAR